MQLKNAENNVHIEKHEQVIKTEKQNFFQKVNQNIKVIWESKDVSLNKELEKRMEANKIRTTKKADNYSWHRYTAYFTTTSSSASPSRTSHY